MKSGAVTNHYDQVVLVIAAVPCSGRLAARRTLVSGIPFPARLAGRNGILMNGKFQWYSSFRVLKNYLKSFVACSTLIDPYGRFSRYILNYQIVNAQKHFYSLEVS